MRLPPFILQCMTAEKSLPLVKIPTQSCFLTSNQLLPNLQRIYVSFTPLMVLNTPEFLAKNLNHYKKKHYCIQGYGFSLNGERLVLQRSLETWINLLYSIYPDRKHHFGIEKKWIYRFKMVYFWLGRYCTNQLICLSEFPVIYGYCFSLNLIGDSSS